MRSSGSWASVGAALGLAGALSACSDEARPGPAAAATPAASDHDRPGLDVAVLHADLDAIRRELTAIREALEKRPPSAAAPLPAAVESPDAEWVKMVRAAEARSVLDAITPMRLQAWQEYEFWIDASNQPDFRNESGEPVSPELCVNIANTYKASLAEMESLHTFEDYARWQHERSRKH
jgi:hypothetical protein